MNYKFLNSLDDKELNQLKEMLSDESFKDNFLKEIEDVIDSRNVKSNIQGIWDVEDIPYYDESLEDKCFSILDNLTVNKFFFFLRTFVEKGNNGNKLTSCSGDAKYMAECFNISVNDVLTLFYNSRFCGDQLTLANFEKFFDEETVRKNYSNSFNVYNYIKSYIYQSLRENYESTSESIFSDYGLKQLIVERDLQKVAAYLCKVRGNDGLRCSIANAGLSRTAKKVSGEITFNQKRLIEAVAFGTTLEKLNAGNYEDSKKLIYLP